MRFVVARMNHETNTFSPVPTPLESFNPRWGTDALQAGRSSHTAMGAFLAFADAHEAEAITPVFATANPSGPVADDAFEAMASSIVDAVRSGCDAILLDLHGAMVTESLEDGEGELLARIRAVAPGVPIGVALDLHGNITEQMVVNADVLVGFKTYPHVDMVETGAHVVRLIQRMLDERLSPKRSWCHPPQLAHTLKMNTGVPGAMQDAITAARNAEERPGVLAVSVFGGFPIADILQAGVSVVTVAETTDLAAEVAREIGALLWERRAEFVYQEEPLRQSIAAARAAGKGMGPGPVLLLDHGDNCMSGGTCDTMDVLDEALAQGLDDIIVGPICDPVAVAAMLEAGVGAEVNLGVGNRVPMPRIGVSKHPLELSGVVRVLGDGQYTISGPTYTGMRCSMGRAAVLDTGRARLLVTELPHEPWDLGVFTSVGLDPRACRYLILKSRMYCRPVFEPIARSVVECASRGVTSSDYTLFQFKNIAKPVYPLQKEVSWIAEAARL
ncbi:M81 family metallopeptidase [Microvirga aerilata]|uniref:Microcystinase C n=1 Tax=Microvirga aerilata TaxID=670292 RepID=A0A936ZHK9_9HYPH|nr:M81 family metallopeptidase [Microvirga aerilata]MBL0407337.1 M81 family metallopeptidase [Microvirga aerilata]